MAQTVGDMLVELSTLQGAGYNWLTAQAFAEFKQAEALQSIAEVLRVEPVQVGATAGATYQVSKRR